MTIACTATDTDIIFKISAAFKNVKITRNISPLQFLNDPMFAFVLVQLRFLEENYRCVTNVVRRVVVVYALNLIYFYVLKFQFFINKTNACNLRNWIRTLCIYIGQGYQCRYQFKHLPSISLHRYPLHNY